MLGRGGGAQRSAEGVLLPRRSEHRGNGFWPVPRPLLLGCAGGGQGGVVLSAPGTGSLTRR